MQRSARLGAGQVIGKSAKAGAGILRAVSERMSNGGGEKETTSGPMSGIVPDVVKATSWGAPGATRMLATRRSLSANRTNQLVGSKDPRTSGCWNTTEPKANPTVYDAD